jgi:hypothetical protein
MSNHISKKQVCVPIDGWRSYIKPVNSIGCCNWTGSYPDSPCPTHVVNSEINGFKKILKKNGIRHRKLITQSSNVFMVKVHILVHPEDREKGLELSRIYRDSEGVRLFYTEN